MIAGVPTTDFSDNRVMRASPRDLFDVYKGTFDYLYENEPMGLWCSSFIASSAAAP